MKTPFIKTVAQLLVERLQAAGIEFVFGLPGGEVVEVLEALRQAGIRFILTHNEASAVFMADAVARLSGKPGVCLTTLGPGATNAVSGIAHAYLDRSPILLITAQKPDHLLPNYTHQVLDLHALYRPITKGTFRLKADNAGATIETALSLLLTGRPGPVHLQLSNEDAIQPAEADTTPLPSAAPHQTNVADLAAARDLLAQAKRPVILAGLGLEPEQPYSALRELAEAAQAPLIATPKSKGALPDDHPLAAGVIGLTSNDPSYQILDQADCIVAVGFDVVELVKPWQQAAPLIWLANWANEDPVLPSAIEFVGPMEPVLQQLTDSTFETAADWGQKQVEAYRATLTQRVLPEPLARRMLPQQVLSTVRANVPRETLLTTDVGSHKIFSGFDWPTLTANRFMVSNGLSCMGFSLPAAIGASLVLTDQPVICLTGDAGMAMVMGELGLVTRLQTPVIIIVMNDAALDLIRSHQVRAGKPVHGTEFTNPDFTAIAQAYDLDAYRVTDEAECAAAIKSAVAQARPALIEAMIDPVGYPTTPRQD